MTVKKKKLAIAIKYSHDYYAPKVIAKGRGVVAKNIIDKAKQKGVFVQENNELAKDLIKINIGQEIPDYLYTAVAEILAYIYRLDSEESDFIDQ